MISTRLVGRERELAELDAALVEAAAGRPAFAFVAGDSGVGKSRLVSEFARGAGAGDAAIRVLSGDCVDLGSAELPYAPILSMLRPMARTGDPILSDLGAHHSLALARLVPGLAAPSDGAPDDDATAQPRIFEALLALFTALSADAPLVLVLEDLHWADRSTRGLVTFLGRTLCTERILVIATYRSDELHRRHPLRGVLAELAREPRARRIELGPLAPAALDEQLADILGHPPERALAQRLWRRTGGNPLFTEELLAAGTDGRGAPPTTLRDALMLRFERLGAAAQGVVRLLAAGQRVDHALLEAAGGLEPALLHEALRETVAGHIVVADPDGSYAFRHALLREVIEDDLLPGERAALHRRLAAALEGRIAADGAIGNDLAAAAAHHHAAGDRPAALSASVRAAEAARRVHAYGEELALLERALEHWPSVPDAAERTGTDHPGLLARAAAAADLHGEAARTETLAAAALALLDAEAEPHRSAAVHVRLARAQRRLGRAGKGLETISHGLALLPAGDTSPERARLLSLRAKVRMLQGRYRDGVEAAHEGLSAARAAGDREAEGAALNALGVCLAATGETDAGTQHLREALAIAVTDRGEQHDAFTNLADVLFLAVATRKPARWPLRASPSHRSRAGRRTGSPP
jgi:predicted ATPase